MRRAINVHVVLALSLGLTLALLRLLGKPAQLPAARAASYTVCPAGPPTCNFATIQAAVDAASSGDFIKVAAGTYTDMNVRPRADVTTTGVVTQMVYINKTVTIQGGYTTTLGGWTTSDPVANPTTLDAQGRGRVLYITGNINPTVAGLRITRGDATGLRGSPSSDDSGGGVYLIAATATISNNWVFSNTATEGGGLYLHGAPNTAALSGNTVISNIARYGGGMYLSSSVAMLSGNTVTSNTAQMSGGGIYLYSSAATLSGNTVTSNTAQNDGGGLTLGNSPATLNNNIVAFNTAQSGGGIYLGTSDAKLSCNIVTSNTAQYGGGVYLDSSSATLTNTVVADNRANSQGSGLYVWASSPHLLHATIARNTGGDDSGVYVTDGPGIYSTVALTNTILVSHTVGISVTGGNAAMVNSVLWFGTPITVSKATTATVAVQNQQQGDPAFASDGYHLRAGSAAINKGVNAGVATDIDGEPRDAAPDLGADEVVWYTLVVNLAGTGSGTVTKNPDTPNYVAGIVVTLTAIPNASSTFAGWSGAVTGTTNPITLTMDANKAVTATFTLACTPVSGADFSFAPAAPKVGQAVTFTGTVTAGTLPIAYTWDFGEGGVGSGQVVTHMFPITTMLQTYTVTLTASNTCSAPSIQRPITVWPYATYTLTVATTGNGSGVVTPTVGTYSYVTGATVWLTATANAGSTFAGWNGAVSGMTNPIFLTMDANKAVTATFNLLLPDTSGKITGMVTASDSSAPLQNVSVYAYTSTTSVDSVAVTWTNASGVYTLTNLTAGIYYIKFDPSSGSNYFPQYYNAKQTLAHADGVVVASSGITADINAALTPRTSVTPLTSMAINGPIQGLVNMAYTFTATVSPVTATTPITYTWSPAPDSGQGTANVSYTWTTPGNKTITVTAQNPANTVTDTHVISVTLRVESGTVYLPVVLHRWPPVPDTPTLYGISNPNGYGSYTVSWSTADLAMSYVLQEARNSSFSDAVQVYSGANTHYDASGKSTGRYYYRVTARNSYGDSGWSNVQWADMLWEAEPNDNALTQANGPIVSGLTYYGAFPSRSDEKDYFYFDLPAARSVELWLTNIPSGCDYDLVLRDANLNQVGLSNKTGSVNEHILTGVLPAGRYYVQVFDFSRTGNTQPYYLRAVYQ